jgi:hypothetical protein
MLLSEEVLKQNVKKLQNSKKLLNKDGKFLRVKAMDKLLKSINGIGFG